MANAPVQIILNSSDYILPVERTNMRVMHKDFFDHDDEGFALHKNQIIESLGELDRIQKEGGQHRTIFVKVSMRRDALAKSYRPINRLFTERNHCEVVGGLRMGEMIIKFMPDAAQKVKDSITEHAELQVRQKYNFLNHRNESAPSEWRCEVSAIHEISSYEPSEKMPFTPYEMAESIVADGVGFYIELFDTPVSRQELDGVPTSDAQLIEQLISRLNSIKGIRIFRSKLDGNDKLLAAYLTDSETSLIRLTASNMKPIPKLEDDADKVSRALEVISSCDLVKKIMKMPNPQKFFAPSFETDGTEDADIPSPAEGQNYPSIGVIDTGISKAFDQWVIDRDNSIPENRLDKTHGTFISGLLVMGKSLNNVNGRQSFCNEPDGCKLYDLAIVPKEESINKVYPSIEDFYDALRSAVEEAVEQGIRIFNLSVNIQQIRRYDEYSPFAAALDALSDEFDVIFIISAGNLRYPRREWSHDWTANIREIDRNGANNIILSPAESLRNISVAALNATDLGLASYSRIGKGTSLSIKPDLVDVGGDELRLEGYGYGIYSVNPSGKIISGRGTSYAAPLVAKTEACLESAIEGYVSRETLKALLIHSAFTPEPFTDKHYGQRLKDIIGWGKPKSSYDILNGDEHSITMVFAGRIKNRYNLSFDFTWPLSLIEDGKLRGKVRLTLVYSPRLNPDYGEEQIRDLLVASLRQYRSDGRKRGILFPRYKSTGKGDEAYLNEWELIEENQKWSPVKVSEREFKGVSGQSNFSLDIEYLTRESYTDEIGIPFTAILTISDPRGEAPVYDQMRSSLLSTNVQLADIQTAARSTLRV